MTITSTPSEITYAGDGVSTVFTIPFVFDTSADLKVVETVAGLPTVVTTGFSIAGGAGFTGTLTRSVALPVGTNILILDNPALTQPVDYVNNDAFPATTHEGALDRLTRITKRLNERADRSLRVADGDLIDGDNNLLPISTVRQGKYLTFDAQGRPSVASGTGNDSALRTDLASAASGSDGSRLVGFRRVDIGAIALAVATVLGRIIFADDFGAVGDNVTNDAAAINAAFTAAALAPAAGRQVVKLTPGKKYYLGGGTLIVPDSVSFDYSFASIRTTAVCAISYGSDAFMLGYDADIETSGGSGAAIKKTNTALPSDMYLLGWPTLRPTTPGVAGSSGIDFTGAYHGFIQLKPKNYESCFLGGSGSSTPQTYYVVLDAPRVHCDAGGTTGIKLRQGANGVHIRHPTVNGGAFLTYLIDAADISGLRVDAGYLESSNDIAATRAIRLTNPSNVTIDGPTCEIATSVAANVALEVIGAVSNLQYDGVGFAGGWGNSAKIGTATGLTSGTFNYRGGVPTAMVDEVGISAFPTGEVNGTFRAIKGFFTGALSAIVSAAAATAHTFAQSGDGIGVEINNNSATTSAARAALVVNRKGGAGVSIAFQNNGAAAGEYHMGSYTVATLPAAGAASRAFATDATVTTFGTVVAGGGANYVPVYRNAAAEWRIG